MKVVVILNPQAGTPAGNPDGCVEALKEVFERNGVQAVIHNVDSAHVPDVVAQARTEGADAVIVGGGDGTIGSVAAALAGTGIPMGVLPLGTFNHFSKDMGIPLELEDAIRIIATGATRDVDVGEVNGHIFLNNSSIGAYPAALMDRDRQRLKTGRRKLTAMVIAVFRVFRRRPLLTVGLTIDGETTVRRTPFVFIGNNAYHPKITSGSLRERMDGGELCVITARSTGLRCLLRMFWAALMRNADRSHNFEYRAAREVTIDLRRKTVRAARDGEIIVLEAPLLFRMRPKALRVIVPRQNPP